MHISVALASLLVVGVLSATDDQQDVTTIGRQSKLGFFGNGATNQLSQLAQDLFSRSTTSSQVLSLNLTNLVILLVVKALIFGAGSLGFGGHDHLGRSIDDSSDGSQTSKSPIVTESELLLMLSYLTGDMNHKYGCLNFAACQDPKKAKEYLMASNILVKGASMFNMLSESKRYEKMLSEAQEAINFGAKGYDCSVRYTCEEKS